MAFSLITIKLKTIAMKKATFLLPVLLFVCAFLVSSRPAPPDGPKVVWTKVVHMDATAAASGEDVKGVAIFRLTSDRVLTYKFVVQKMDEDDMLMSAHFHYTATGGVAIPLPEGIANLGHFAPRLLTQPQYDLLVDGEVGLYVNLHSTQYPGGIISGEVD